MQEISTSVCAHDDSVDYLSGRDQPQWLAGEHFVSAHALVPPYPDGFERAMFGLGCFWGAEKSFWKLPGVYITAVGYSAGRTPYPNYKEVCSGRTGHNEVVLVVFDPALINYSTLLKHFWQAHNPTQGMRQGNHVGTQYRSGIYTHSDEQFSSANDSLRIYQTALHDAGYGEISTEICPASEFYFAEQYHQQYLAKNPHGYCGLGGLQVAYPSVSGL